MGTHQQTLNTIAKAIYAVLILCIFVGSPSFGYSVDIEVHVNGKTTTTSADFTANVVTGAIHLYGLNLENLHTSSIRTTGTLGEGEGQIDLETVNGPITVKGF